MNKYLYSGISFVVGAAVGAVPTYLYLKKDFEKSLDRAVEEVKLTYMKKYAPWNNNTPIPNCSGSFYTMRNINVDDIEKATEYLENHAMSDTKVVISDEAYEKAPEDKEPPEENYIDWEKQVEISDPPALITAEECGADPYRFDTLLLTYFSDEILTDDDYIPLQPEEFEDTIGMDIKKLTEAFEDEGWEDDHLYVRNFKRHIDYEIAYSYETYEEYLEKHPYLTE